MSVIRKKPFIQSVIDTLSGEELSALTTVLNSGGNNVNVSLVTGNFEKGEGKTITSSITPVYIELELNKFYSAILIWNASYCVAVAYHRFPDVRIFKINATAKTYEVINEPCDINELRRVVEVASVEAGQITSAVSNVNYDTDDKAITKTIDGETTEVVSASTLKTDMGLDNVTNNAQVKGLASGTTQGNLVSWGADGYTVADSGKSVVTSIGANPTDAQIPTALAVKSKLDDKANKTEAVTSVSFDTSNHKLTKTINSVSSDVLEFSTSIGSNPTNAEVPTSLAVKNLVDALPSPMIFKGTVGSSGTVEWANLPSASSSNEGFTYKVITANASGVVCEVGDTIISNGSSWVVIPSGDEPSGTVTNVATGSGLSGGPITSSGTISLATAYGDTVNPYGAKNKNKVLAGPDGSSGHTADAVPSFRELVANDIPDLSGTYYSTSNPNGYTSNTGTVTNVALSVPTGLSVSGSPITSSGTLAISLASGYTIPTADANGCITSPQGYLTTAPTQANPYGLIKVVLTSEPATYYSGYEYIIVSE